MDQFEKDMEFLIRDAEHAELVGKRAAAVMSDMVGQMDTYTSMCDKVTQRLRKMVAEHKAREVRQDRVNDAYGFMLLLLPHFVPKDSEDGIWGLHPDLADEWCAVTNVRTWAEQFVDETFTVPAHVGDYFIENYLEDIEAFIEKKLGK
jgi:hypothetical protein